jgi:hypothetical protein
MDGGWMVTDPGRQSGGLIASEESVCFSQRSCTEERSKLGNDIDVSLFGAPAGRREAIPIKVHAVDFSTNGSAQSARSILLKALRLAI